MVWFFLAGWIAGAVWMVLFAKWWITKHAKRVTFDELKEEFEEKEEDKTHE